MKPLADRAAALTPQQRKLLELRLGKEGFDLSKSPIIRHAGEDDRFPLSSAQEQLWLIHQMDPSSSLYNLPSATSFKGELNLIALEQSFSEILRRHEILRSVQAAIDGRPVQMIRPPRRFTFSVVDLTTIPEGERDTEAKRQAVDEFRKPFDLNTGPLLRIRLLRLEEENVLLMTAHHSVFDALSMSILSREVAELYRAFSGGQPCLLPEPPVQYVDYAAWQRRWLASESFERQLHYWKRKLEGELPVLTLPTDRPRPPVQTFKGAKLSVQVPEPLAFSLRELGGEHGVTLFMTLLAAFQILLHRYTGQEDILIGAPVANRSQSAIQSLIGFFINTLVLRADLSGEPSFTALLRRVRDEVLAVQDHSDMPFEKLVEELDPQRYLSHSPLFQTIFTVQERSRRALELPGLSSIHLPIEEENAKFDLAFDAMTTEGAMIVAFTYNTDLFDTTTIARMIGHFENLLKAAAVDPHRPVSRLSFLSEAERHQLLLEWNDTGKEYAGSNNIHELIEAQVARTPDAVAVVFEDEVLSYRQLNNLANRLASVLASRGTGSGSYVPVLMDRGVEVVIALLAVMKTGAAFAPVDADWPAARIERVLDELNGEALLVNARTSIGGELAHAPFILVDTDRKDDLCRNLNIDVSGDDAIYVIYTSGSTGAPKGAVVSHRGITNRFLWMNEVFRKADSLAVLQTTQHVYDSAVWQLFWPLINGGRAVMPPRDMEITARRLGDVIERNEITMTDLVPSALDILLADLAEVDGPYEKFRSLRSLIIGGEEISPRTVKNFLDRFPGVRVVNIYGPTEASIGCIYHEVSGEEAGRMPIGRPIANAQALILDRSMAVVPVGAVGEIYLAGNCLGRGYLHDPDRTRRVFVDNPIEEVTGEALYKTGDLGRYLPDGRIEFLGRFDEQVKIRGFRIEMGEITGALKQHPLVRDAVVILSEFAGDRRLAAYVVPADGSPLSGGALSGGALSGGALRAFLRERLPEYMLPSAYVSLESLPLLPNGKVNRRVLPTPDWAALPLEQEFAAPRSPVEEGLAEIWSGVLNVERVGIRDSFFDLGGHSLLAAQLISRIRQAFRVDIPLRSVFESPDVAGLAAIIESALRESRGIRIPPLVAAAREGAVPLSLAQEPVWLIDRLLAGAPFFNIPAAARLKGRLNIIALRQSVEEVARRHESLRTTFDELDGRPIQVIARKSGAGLDLVDLRHLERPQRDGEIIRLAAEESRGPFDLIDGPLFRVRLLLLDDDESLLLFTMHHIIGDGWSMGLLVREVSVSYGAFSEGRPSNLPELSTQYADYALWQRGLVESPLLDEARAYWNEQLEPPLLPLGLIGGQERASSQSLLTAREVVTIPSELLRAIKALGGREGSTLFVTLLAAFNFLLHLYAGDEDIRVGTIVANRNHLETESLIGLFINTLVLRTKVSGRMSFLELLGNTRDVVLEAYAHQDLPFEVVSQSLARERAIDPSSIFQVMFLLQNAPSPSLDLPGASASALASDGAIWERNATPSTFDLVFVLQESDDRLVGVMKYKAALFDAGLIRAMLDDFRNLLGLVIKAPDRRLSQFMADAE